MTQDDDPIKALAEAAIRRIFKDMKLLGPNEVKHMAAAIKDLDVVRGGGESGGINLAELLKTWEAEDAESAPTPRPRPTGPGSETDPED